MPKLPSPARLLAPLGAVLGLGLALAAPALATNPGRNGAIAYVGQTGDSGQGLFAVGGDGSGRRLLGAGNDPEQPAWSPTGDRLAHAWFCGGSCGIGVGTTTAAGVGDLGAFTFWAKGPSYTPEGYPVAETWLQPSWSPDGQRLVVHGPGGLWVVGERGERRQLTDQGAGFDVQPAWAPSGRTIAFARCSGTLPGPGFAYAGCRLHVVGAGAAPGAWSRIITPAGVNSHDPSWAPDARRIAYEVGTPRGTGLGIHTVRPDGTDRRRVFASGWTPAFSPDGTRITLAMGSGLYVGRADGTALRRVAAGYAADPDWQPLR